jgi:SAM-dependent methyltransferase
VTCPALSITSRSPIRLGSIAAAGSSALREAVAADGHSAAGKMLVVGPLPDKRVSFNEVPDIYDEIRPSYPAGLYDVLFGMLPRQPEIVEVGPGTGQATKDLLDRGATVHAVEIGPATAAKLRSNLATDRLRVTVGDFEHVAMAPSCADAVFSATAYHWISPQAQTDRPATLLRPNGVVAIVDLIQVTSPEDRGFFDAAQPIYEKYGEGHLGPEAPTREEIDPPIRKLLDGDDRFDDVRTRQWDWDQTYSAAEYRKLMLSYSVTQLMAPSERLGLLDDMEAFINEHFGSHITRPLVATLTTARLC